MSALVDVENIKKYYPVGGFLSRSNKVLRALDGVTLKVERGQTLGIAGESGCGKTTLGLVCLKLLEATEGRIEFEGRDITRLNDRQMRELRSDMQIIFQDPYGALNPRKSLHQILSVPLELHANLKRTEAKQRIQEMMEIVGLTPSDLYLDRRPDDLSGGQRQRVVIARAMMTRPKFVVADEPVSALDMSVRAQILNLMKDLQKKMGLAFLYISHDLSVTRSISHEVGIMYLGKIVELASADEIFTNPLHPYTEALLSAVPLPNPRKTRSRSRIILKGERPSPIDLPPGCRFKSRCFRATSKCTKSEPKLLEVKKGHLVSCILT